MARVRGGDLRKQRDRSSQRFRWRDRGAFIHPVFRKCHCKLPYYKKLRKTERKDTTPLTDTASIHSNTEPTFSSKRQWVPHYLPNFAFDGVAINFGATPSPQILHQVSANGSCPTMRAMFPYVEALIRLLIASPASSAAADREASATCADWRHLPFNLWIAAAKHHRMSRA